MQSNIVREKQGTDQQILIFNIWIVKYLNFDIILFRSITRERLMEAV